AGMGVAEHGMSNAYLAHHALPPSDQSSLYTQGYIGAVQTPFAIPLVGGKAETTTLPVYAYMQNEYHDASPILGGIPSLPGAFAFVEPPVGLELSDSTQSQRLSFGNIPSLGS